MNLSVEEIAKIEKYDVQQRLNYLVKTVVAYKEIWILTDEHGCVMLNSEDEDCIPVWPNKEFAISWATGDWQGFKAESIALTKWHSHWTTGLEEDEIAIVAFPNKQEEGLVLYPEEFDSLLKKAFKKALNK